MIISLEPVAKARAKKGRGQLVPILMSEDELQKNVIELAHLLGYLVAHFRPARVMRNGEESWRTAVGADGQGFPDLVLVRPHGKGKTDRVIFCELKSEKGRLSPAQEVWLEALDETFVEVYVWRPHNWSFGEIEEILT